MSSASEPTTEPAEYQAEHECDGQTGDERSGPVTDDPGEADVSPVVERQRDADGGQECHDSQAHRLTSADSRFEPFVAFNHFATLPPWPHRARRKF